MVFGILCSNWRGKRWKRFIAFIANSVTLCPVSGSLDPGDGDSPVHFL